MKNLLKPLFFGLLVLMAGVFVFTSCTKEDVNPVGEDLEFRTTSSNNFYISKANVPFGQSVSVTSGCITLKGYRFLNGSWVQVRVVRHTGTAWGWNVPAGSGVIGVGGYNGADQDWGAGSRTLDNIGYNEKLEADFGGTDTKNAQINASIYSVSGTMRVNLFDNGSLISFTDYPVTNGANQLFNVTSAADFDRIEITFPSEVAGNTTSGATLVAVNSIGAVESYGFNAISPSQVLVANVVGSGTTYTVEGEIKLTGNAGISFRNDGTKLTGQGGVSTAGFGVQGGSCSVASSRGIDGGESMTIEAANGTSMTSTTLTIGLNNCAGNILVNWSVEVYDGATLLTTISGTVNGAVNSLHDIPVSASKAFTKMVLKNTGTNGTEPFALSKVNVTAYKACVN